MLDPYRSQSARRSRSIQAMFGARTRRVLICAVLSVLVGACTTQTARHGQIFTEAEIKQIKKGMTQEQVSLTLGSPNTKSTVGDGVYYYISTKTEKPIGFMKPEVVDRRVLAVYFEEDKTVKRVAHYGLEDGKVVDFISRKTPTYKAEDGLLKELFRNVGSGVKPQLSGS